MIWETEMNFLLKIAFDQVENGVRKKKINGKGR